MGEARLGRIAKGEATGELEATAEEDEVEPAFAGSIVEVMFGKEEGRGGVNRPLAEKPSEEVGDDCGWSESSCIGSSVGRRRVDWRVSSGRASDRPRSKRVGSRASSKRES